MEAARPPRGGTTQCHRLGANPIHFTEFSDSAAYPSIPLHKSLKLLTGPQPRTGLRAPLLWDGSGLAFELLAAQTWTAVWTLARKALGE